jgi:hypothetical protein
VALSIVDGFFALFVGRAVRAARECAPLNRIDTRIEEGGPRIDRAVFPALATDFLN